MVLDQVKALATTEHDRKTLVIDSITKVFTNEIAREAERLQDAGKKNEFGADRKPAVGAMRQLVAWFPRLNMNVILIAGETAEWGLVNGERAQIGTTFDCWPRLEYELDLAIGMFKAGSNQLARVREDRLAAFPQGDTFDCNYEELATRIGDVIEETPLKESFATPEQLAEVARLLDIVRLEDGTVDKWLAAANVSAWDEMTEERIGKAIVYLQNKISQAGG